MYKGINPTCHDFNSVTATADSASLLVGFSTGIIQLIDPIKKELNKLYNEEVNINYYPIQYYKKTFFQVLVFILNLHLKIPTSI